MINKNIDSGKAFDWGRAAADYAKYRDIYPPAFYGKILELSCCTKGQNVLDIGTGTGVLPEIFTGSARILLPQIFQRTRSNMQKN